MAHKTSNRAMQRTASKRTICLLRVAIHPFPCVDRVLGFAVADLGSR